MARRYINSEGVEFKPMNVEMPVSIHRAAKRIAADEGWSLSQLVQAAVAEFVERRQAAAPVEVPDGTYQET